MAPIKLDLPFRFIKANLPFISRLHLKSHTDARDYKCETCHRGFFTRGKLIEHERTHTGD